jgi:hypothetical protein
LSGKKIFNISLTDVRPENFFDPTTFLGKIGPPKYKFAPGPRISLIGPDGKYG